MKTNRNDKTNRIVIVTAVHSKTALQFAFDLLKRQSMNPRWRAVGKGWQVIRPAFPNDPNEIMSIPTTSQRFLRGVI